MKMPPSRFRVPPAWLPAVLAAMALAVLAAPAWGQFATPKLGSGLTMTVDPQWVDGNGYRPVLITISASGLTGFASNRDIHIEYRAKSWYDDADVVVVSQDIELPAGTTVVTATLAVPERSLGQRVVFEVIVDGKRSKSLSFETNLGTVNYSQGWEEGVPSLLFVGDADQTPDTGALGQLFEASQQIQQSTGMTVNGASGLPLAMSATIAPGRLPERALDYSSVDVLCLSVDQLKSLAANRPAALAAIRLWNAAGGNLFVWGAGSDWSRLGEIEALLDLPALPAADVAVARGWDPPDNLHFDVSLRNYLDSNAGYGYSATVQFGPNGQAMAPVQIGPDGQPIDANAHLAALRPAEAPFHMRRHGEGMVVALAAADPFPGKNEEWAWVFNQLGPERFLWYNRHGISLRQGNPDVINWVIPGVGEAPVNAFRLLITLFVVVIGPLNYYFLWRRGRLHLLLVIVPAFAALVTASLFAYAMASDGLGVRVRARTFTRIDQRRGEAVCWARLSYYAGLAPADGLTFPADVAVYPIQHRVENNYRSNLPTQYVNWTGEGQQLTDGWIQARVPAQLQTCRARTTTSGLEFSGWETGGAPRVKNLLGTRIGRLLAVGPAGEVLLAENVAAGATVDLQPATDVADALSLLRRAIDEQRPQMPLGVQSGYSGGGLFGGPYYYSNSPLPDPEQGKGRLERGILEVIGLTPDSLRPRTYAAIVDRSPEAAYGVRSPQEDASLHVVVGEW